MANRFKALVAAAVIMLLFGCATTNVIYDNQPRYAGFADIDQKKDFFIVVGDTQKTSHWEFWRERNDRERKLVNNEITKRGPAFVLHLGDLTARGQSIKHWTDFDNMNMELRAKKIPLFPVLGNHEYYGDEQTALRNYFSRFQHLEQRHWYSFTWKNMAFIMLNSNLSTLSDEQLRQQTEWYLNELKIFDADKRIAHIIVCCHKPPFTNSTVVRPDKDVRNNFADPFMKVPKAKIFFSGHSHAYERFQQAGKTFIVSGGGGGPRHKLITDKAEQLTEDQYAGPEVRPFHFCEVEVSGNNLKVRIVALDDNGEFHIIESLTI